MAESKNIFMIMCHKNADQVIRLVNIVKTNHTDVVIHVDINMPNEEHKKIYNCKKQNKGVYLVDKRIHGELDKRSLVDIAIEMVKHAKNIEIKENKHYKYYALLSGQDYLIKNIEFIEEELDSIYPKPLIDCNQYSKKSWIYYKFNSNKTLLQYNYWISSRLKKELIRSGLRL